MKPPLIKKHPGISLPHGMRQIRTLHPSYFPRLVIYSTKFILVDKASSDDANPELSREQKNSKKNSKGQLRSEYF